MRMIGLTGKAGAGKDSVAAIMVSQAGYARVAFADPLKAARQMIFGLSPDWLLEGMKNIVHPYWQLTPRRMDQLLGTEAIRNTFGANTWVRRALYQIEVMKADGASGFVISDVRFDNEAKAVRDQGGVVVSILRPDNRHSLEGDEAAHTSEQPIATRLIDHVINNDGNMIELHHKVCKLLEVIASETYV